MRSLTPQRPGVFCPGRRSQKIHKIIFQKGIDKLHKVWYNVYTKEREVKRMERKIYFDCDGTWIDLYGVEGWLDDLINHNARPYIEAKPLIHLATFARLIHKLQAKGYQVGIISWLSKNSTDDFDEAVTLAKLNWFKKHLPSVEWDEIHIVSYGTPKSLFGNETAILFDDEKPNRDDWIGIAYDEKNIIEVLRAL